MHRFPQHRMWNFILALCLCVGALAVSSTAFADLGDGSDFLRGPDTPPGNLGAGDPDIPQGRSATKPGTGSSRRGVGIYRSGNTVEGVEAGTSVWMMRFHAAARLWAAYFVRR